MATTRYAKEIWKPIKNFVGIYSISSHRRIRRDCDGHATHTGKILAQTLRNTGYLYVVLYLGGVQTQKSVHELMAESFIGPRPRGNHVNHKNGIKTDNRPENLEYCTPAENNRHMREVLGVGQVGERHGMAKLNWKKAREIRRLRASGRTLMNLAKRFGVCQSTIFFITSGQTWKEGTDAQV